MKNRGTFAFCLLLLLALPLLACNPNVVTAWGDLLETAEAIWAGIWATPEPDYYGISILCDPDLLAAYGNPPNAYVDDVALTTQEIATLWGVSPPYTQTLTLGTPYVKPDGSGRTMVPFQFTNPYSDVYGVPYGAPLTGLCLEFEDVDVEGTPVPLLADGYQVGDYVLPTTTPQVGYAECPSGITPTPTPTPTPIPTDTPTPAPGDGYEPDNPYPPYNSSIAVGEAQWRTLEPYGDEEYVHLWVWPGLHVRVRTHSLGGYASTNVQVPTCNGTYSDTDGGESSVEWVSSCPEVVVIHVWSGNGYFGPGESYVLEVEQLP
ncbi:MAG: hypothetical protein PVH17_02275 [Anaerolineae bacterium]